jgi:hypothetical protein
MKVEAMIDALRERYPEVTDDPTAPWRSMRGKRYHEVADRLTGVNMIEFPSGMPLGGLGVHHPKGKPGCQPRHPSRES